MQYKLLKEYFNITYLVYIYNINYLINIKNIRIPDFWELNNAVTGQVTEDGIALVSQLICWILVKRGNIK